MSDKDIRAILVQTVRKWPKLVIQVQVLPSKKGKFAASHSWRHLTICVFCGENLIFFCLFLWNLKTNCYSLYQTEHKHNLHFSFSLLVAFSVWPVIASNFVSKRMHIPISSMLHIKQGKKYGKLHKGMCLPECTDGDRPRGDKISKYCVVYYESVAWYGRGKSGLRVTHETSDKAWSHLTNARMYRRNQW